MVTCMASRRKSSKPTNKLRKVLTSCDEDEDSDLDSSGRNDSQDVQTDALSGEKGRQIENGCLVNSTQGNLQPVVTQMSSGGLILKYPTDHNLPHQSTSQNIALPCDVLRDFEALKSATNLDSSQLIRKLLRDYQKLACDRSVDPLQNHDGPDSGNEGQRLDFQKSSHETSSNNDILDLSASRKTIPEHDSPETKVKYHSLTDDQIAMGKFAYEDLNTAVTPLDLTVPKQSSLTSFPCQEMKEGNQTVNTHAASSLFSASFPTSSCASSEVISKSSHADMYVINLEPDITHPEKASTSAHWEYFQSTMVPTSSSQTTETDTGHFKHDEIPTSSAIHCLPITKDEELMYTETLHNSHALLLSDALRKHKQLAPSLPLSLSSSSELPSYNQAITLSTSLPTKGSWKEMCQTIGGKNLASDSSVRLSKEGKRVSVLQLKPGTLEKRSKETMGKLRICDQFLDHSASNTTNLSPEREHVFSPSASLPIYNNFMPSTTAASFQSSYHISCPNFLITSSASDSTQDTTSTPILASMPSSGPDTSSISGAMQIPALIMTTGPGGVIGNVLAIPILQGPSEDSGMPNYSFAPSTTDPTSKGITPSCSTQTSLVASDILPSTPNELRTISTPDQSNCPVSDSSHVVRISSPASIRADIVDNTAAMTSYSQTSVVDCAKNPSRKSANKDIKLLTENTLFPGVYTSILKLPWSKRIRNKSKSKSSHEKKKKQHKGPSSKRNTHGRRKSLSKEEEDKRLNVQYSRDSVFFDGPITKTLAKGKESKVMNYTLNDNTPEKTGESTSDIQIKDFEQQKRLHYQYHVRLQEEQQKLKREMDTSFCKVSESPLSLKRAKPSCSINQSSPLLKPLDSEDQNYTQSEIRHNVMLSSASLPSANEHPSSSCLDPIMLVYPNVGPTSSPKSKRRGRPPKAPMMSSRISESSLFPLDSVFSVVDSHSEATLFPSINTTMSSSMLSPDSIQTLPVTSSALSSNDISQGDSEEKPIARLSTVDSSTDGQMSLEKKINYLTTQIEIEMAQNRAKKDASASLSESSQREETSGQSTSKVPESKSVENVKTRRKKTSRMLKSNENFIYATFRFKPRGSHAGVKKSTRKSKDVSASAAAAAETIASLKDRKLKGSLGDKSKGTSKLDPLIHAWKFHEQYPCLPSSPKASSTAHPSNVCLTCGTIFKNSMDLQSQQTQCDSCSFPKQMKFSNYKEEENKCDIRLGDGNDKACDDKRDYCRYRNETEKALIIKMSPSGTNEMETLNQGNVEELSTTCIKCGKGFIKTHAADPSTQCFSCKQLISSVINSSKLFSLPTSSQTSSKVESADDLPACDSFQYEAISGQHISQKANGLFCSKCRMQFVEIVDYLNHIKKTHEKSEEQTTKVAHPACPSGSYTSASGRKGKMSTKNKKSLSHKTITCPVEDCPLFFRHQRDMDFHLKKAHGYADYCLPTMSNDDNLSQGDGDPTCPPVSVNLTGTSGGMLEAKTSSIAESTSSSQEKPLQCDICDFRCRQKNALTWHMRKHPEAAWQHRRYSSMTVE